MKKILLTACCTLLLAGNLLFAQNAHFTTSGTIEYNKSVNMYAIIKKGFGKSDFFGGSFTEEYKKNHPQFAVLKSTLNFASNKALFTPRKEDDDDANGWFASPMVKQINTVYTDFAARQSITQKQVFEQTFLVKDTARKIKWKITGETRDIAGYTCRRANGIMMDSVYVVAFYAEKIHVSGGPESFNGLPGMILEVALPHENIIWLATKVTDMPLPDNAIAPPKTGKPVNNAELKSTLKGAMKGWGGDSDDNMKGYLF